jgi:hypothetical protein
VKVFENTMLRGLFGPKRDKAVGGWRKLHNEELHDSFSSTDIIRIMKRRIRRAGMLHAWRGRRMCRTYRVLVGNRK